MDALTGMDHMAMLLSEGDIVRYRDAQQMRVGMVYEYYYLKRVKELNKLIDDNAYRKAMANGDR